MRDASAGARVPIELVHSPLVGPSSWHPTANVLARRGCLVATPSVGNGPVPAWHGWHHRLGDRIASQAGDHPRVLVGHSAAGLLVPAIAQRVHTVGLVFVDARIPPDDGEIAPAEEEFLAFVRSRADADGMLPPRSRWWGDAVIERLVPDPAARDRFEADVPRLPVAWFDDVAEVPPWTDIAAGYVQLSPAYAAEADDARSRGWPVAVVDGTHVSTVTHPDAVATAITAVLTGLHLRTDRLG
jgi:hypothetical protein